MQLFTNNATSRLLFGISNVSLSLQVAAGEGDKFPSPTGGDYFLVTLLKIISAIEQDIEIVKVTARVGDVFTIVRAQEGTTAKGYSIDDHVQLRMTAGASNLYESHVASVANPHTVTQTQVGLSNVDNTSDANKPVSTAQQTALNTKQDTLVSGTSIKTVNSTSLLGSGNVVTGDVTLTGTQTLTNKTITETVYAVTGTTPALATANGAVQTWTLSGASTPTAAGIAAGQSIILQITPGAYTITWPSVTWTKVGGSGAAPTLFSAGKTNVVLWMVGSVLYGSHLGDNA